jgi:signal transduction histidine kinase
MGYLQGNSIKQRLLRIGLLTAAVALIVAVLVLSIRDFVLFRDSLLRNLAVEAKIIGDNCTAALTFNNRKDAEATLGALRNSPNIVFALIYNKDGSVFGEYHRDARAADFKPPPFPRTYGHAFGMDRVSLSQPILMDDEFLGTIFIRSDLSEFYYRLEMAVGSAVLIFLFTLSVAMLLLMKWQRTITDPIRALTGLMQTVSREKDYFVRADIQEPEELGTLSAGFNDMLVQIQERDAELEMHRMHLEELVAERTAELARTNVSLERELAERERAEAALRQSEDRYRGLSQEFHALLEAIPDSLTLLTPDLKVLWANQGAAKGMKKALDDVVGRHCYALWDGRDSPCDICPVQRTFKAGDTQSDVVPSTDERFWDVRTVPLKDQDGKVTRVIEVARDITEQRRMEEQLRHAQKIEAVGQLAGGVAHDFNNILTAIIGFATLIQMKLQKDDALQPYVRQIMESSERAAGLTHGLLAFSRKQIINPKPVDVNKVVGEIESLISRLIREDIELSVILSDRKLTILADSGQIEQVLINLATNARDAMPEGGRLLLKTELTAIDEDFIKAHGYGTSGLYALITVSDTGLGMDIKTRARIFEPFFTTKEVGKGTGLGLAIVYGIVKQHGGYINCYSEPEFGTTFNIYLPLTEQQAQQAVTAPRTAIHGGTETILVAEDDDRVRELVVEVLTQHGYTVIAAPDGEQAVRIYKENKDRIQMLLLDVIMPKKNGREVYDAIRAISPHIKVLFTSGYTANIIHKKGVLEEGFNFIFKPVAPHVLLKKVREVLDGH